MSFPPSVVISCAGMATRLGMGMTKALIDIRGKPLIHWQLAMLAEVPDVRVVVGYQAEQVIECARAARPDLVFVFNRDFATTGTAKSLCLGALGAQGDVISLDGDLLVHPHDFRTFAESKQPLIGYLPVASSQPVLVEMQRDDEGEFVSAFSMEAGSAEWSGLARVPADELRRANDEGRAERHVYEILEPLLPIPAYPVRATEVDTLEDYERALQWMDAHRYEWENSP